jgi:general secretion pathway protein D
MHRFAFAFCAAFVVLAGAGLARQTATAPDAAEIKIRLLSDALRARDSGNLAEARAKLEELLKFAPGDATVSRLLASLDQRSQTKVTVSGGVVTAPNDAEQLAKEEEQRLARTLAEANDGIRRAQGLAAGREFSAALDLLAQLRRDLAENPATQSTILASSRR